MIKTVGISGLGAVGTMYAIEIGKVIGRDNVYVIADEERINRYKTEGVYGNEKLLDLNYVVDKDAPVVDLVVFATKIYGLRKACESAKYAIDDHTIVFSALNGVTSEGIIDEIIHPKHLLYGTVQGMDATKHGNKLTYTVTGTIAVNEKDNTRSQAVEDMLSFFEKTSMGVFSPENIQHQMWSKWMLNVGLNQACAMYGVGYGAVCVEGEPREAMLKGMKEAQLVAQAEGVNLTDEEIVQWDNVVKSLSPDGEPSMQQDMRAGRPTEVALFAETAVKLGDKHGIETPQNDIYLKFFNER